MFRNLLFTMSMSGSMVLLCYIFSYPLTKRYFSVVWRYRILKTAIVFYLIPFSEWKYQVVDFIEKRFPVFWSSVYHFPEFDSSYSIIVTNGVMHFSLKVRLVICILAICGIVSFVILLTWIMQYRNIRQVYLNYQKEPVPEKYRQLFLELKNEMNIRRNIKLVCFGYVGSPMTSGILFPVVYFPYMEEDQPDMESCRYMMRHELIHIKHYDLLVKLLSLLVIAVHWFNPLSFLLYNEISDTGEMCCDEAVLKEKGEKERKEYCELLLHTATRKTDGKESRFLVGMSDFRSRIMFKRRILEMKRKKKNRFFSAMTVMGLVCMTGGITAFAYDPPRVLDAGNQEVSFGVEFINGVEPEALLEIENLPYSLYFVDENGEILELDETDLPERAVCDHNYGERGIIKEHIKNSVGGCVVKTYEGKVCLKCGNIQLEKRINTVSYEYCPHG